MIDSHVHFGHFCEKYYQPDAVIDTVISFGVKEVYFSSTSSCIQNIEYAHVENEIENVYNKYSSQVILKPFLWYLPEYARQGLLPSKLIASFPYAGIKIHPRAQIWNLQDPEVESMVHLIFSACGENNIPVLIHTGTDAIDEANTFGMYFKRYRSTQVILAHCRPLEQAAALMHEFSHIFCDTAFVEAEDIDFLIRQSFKKKILLGSDFPITHYYSNKYFKTQRSLTEQYAYDISTLQAYASALNIL